MDDITEIPCSYCGRIMSYKADKRLKLQPTRDYFYPRSRFKVKPGTANVVKVCLRCNQKKGSRTPTEYLVYLELTDDPSVKVFRRFMYNHMNSKLRHADIKYREKADENARD